MAMKQTQTKLFDFSDVGLDFCAGSKNLFPDRFKKMLALGYNEQTVSSVAVAGNQVTFTYGGTHGYVADRVLKVSSPELLSINGGEFVIDSVTANTVTMTIDGAPTSVAGNFTTKVAALGWSLEYELGQVQLYKMKYLDERDLYVRFVFASGAQKNMVNVCVGKIANANGEIIDPLAHNQAKTNTTATNGFGWMFSAIADANSNNFTYSQGMTNFGRGMVVGSKYHISIACNALTTYAGRILAILPTQMYDYEELDYPLIIGNFSTIAIGSTSAVDYPQLSGGAAAHTMLVGSIAVALNYAETNADQLVAITQSVSSYLPATLDTFDTVPAFPIQLFEKSTKLFIGMCAGGLYRAEIKNTNAVVSVTSTPSITADIDLGNLMVQHFAFAGSGATFVHAFIAPVEEIKLD